MKIALVRGGFLNQYEGQMFYPLAKRHELVAFSSIFPIHDSFPFKVIKLPSPVDINFGPLGRFKMPILNRMFVDAHWLIGLEDKLRGYDIAHCSDTYFHFTRQCLMAKKKGNVKKVVATIYENLPFNNESILGRKKFKRDAINFVDRFIAVSERSKETLLLEGCSEDKITVLSPGIDTKRFRRNVPHPVHTKQVTILFSGRLESYKGVYEIIYAAKRLLADISLAGYVIRFKIVGDGSQKESIKKLSRRLGIVDFINMRSVEYSRMENEYWDADIFVAPSKETSTYQEQFGTVLMEAQAAGLPIVTTLSGSIPENVNKAGLYVNPGDFYSLSNALKRLITNPALRKEYSVKALANSKKYNSDLIAKKIEQIYQDILSE